MLEQKSDVFRQKCREESAGKYFRIRPGRSVRCNAPNAIYVCSGIYLHLVPSNYSQMKINTQYTDLIEWLGQRFNRHSVAIAAPAMSCLFSKGQEDAPADDSQVAAVKVVGFWLWIFGKGAMKSTKCSKSQRCAIFWGADTIVSNEKTGNLCSLFRWWFWHTNWLCSGSLPVRMCLGTPKHNSKTAYRRDWNIMDYDIHLFWSSQKPIPEIYVHKPRSRWQCWSCPTAWNIGSRCQMWKKNMGKWYL